MERTKANIDPAQEQKIRFKKVGGGSLWLGGHIIKEDQVFYAKPSDIPEAFKDQIHPVDSLPEQVKPNIPGKVTTYTAVPRGKSTTLFDVVNEAGKVLNEKGLTKEKADKLVIDLSA